MWGSRSARVVSRRSALPSLGRTSFRSTASQRASCCARTVSSCSRTNRSVDGTTGRHGKSAFRTSSATIRCRRPLCVRPAERGRRATG